MEYSIPLRLLSVLRENSEVYVENIESISPSISNCLLNRVINMKNISRPAGIQSVGTVLPMAYFSSIVVPVGGRLLLFCGVKNDHRARLY